MYNRASDMRASILLAVFAVPAFLTVPLQAQPIFSLKPDTVTVTIPAGTTGDLTRKVNFTLVNEGSLADFLLRSDQSWVTLDQERGFVDFMSSVPLSVTVVADGFDVGEYTAHVTITSSDNVSVTLTIVLQITGIRIGLNPNTVSFSLMAGSSSSTPVAVTGLNGAVGQVIVERVAGGGWLTWTLAPITGELPATVTVMANTEGLAIGSYTGRLRVSCFVLSTQCTPQVINVSLQVFGLSQLNVNPNSIFYSTTTSAPATQSSALTLTNTGAETNFTTTIVNLPGVSVSPTSGTVRPNQPLTITVTANPNNVTPGRYSGSIQFAGGGSSATVSVSFQITGIGLSQSTVTLSSLKGRTATTTFVVTGTEQFTIQRQSGGAWLTFAPTFGVAPQTVTVTADAATLPEGLSQGSLVVNCGADCLSRTVIVQFNVTALRVVSSADYKAALAPGTIAAAFGPGITTLTQSATLPLPLALAGVSVGVQDSAGKQFQAPLFFVSPGQVNFLVPEGVALGPAIVTIRNAAGVYASETFTIAAVGPSLYTQDGSGTGPPAAFARYFSSSGSETTALVAACDAANSCTPVAINVNQAPTVFLELYGTGIRNRSDLSKVSVNIGGTILPVVYAGAQSQFPGLDQVDVQLQASLAGRGAVTAVLIVDGVSSQPVNLVFQ